MDIDIRVSCIRICLSVVPVASGYAEILTKGSKVPKSTYCHYQFQQQFTQSSL